MARTKRAYTKQAEPSEKEKTYKIEDVNATVNEAIEGTLWGVVSIAQGQLNAVSENAKKPETTQLQFIKYQGALWALLNIINLLKDNINNLGKKDK